MPAPRVPTPILDARGSFKKNPQRAAEREDEPVVTDPIGGPPVCFLPSEDGYHSSEAKRLLELWNEFVAEAAPGVLNRSHRSALEEMCRLKLKTRSGSAKTGDRANYKAMLMQFGMTPAAQSTVRGVKKDDGKEESVFGKLASQARARGA